MSIPRLARKYDDVDNPYRHTPTRDLIVVRESLGWDLVEYQADAESFGHVDHIPERTTNAIDYLSASLSLAEAELARRERLRHRPGAPAWPSDRADVARLKAAVDLVAFVETYGPAAFAARGGRFWARCPFDDHADATASFSVNAERRLFHCFGCGRGGDVFTFVQEMFGLGFWGALVFVAGEAGLPLPPRPPDPSSRIVVVRHDAEGAR
jgi:hypothetical protein